MLLGLLLLSLLAGSCGGSFTARGELAVAVVEESWLSQQLRPHLDVVAYEASRTAAWGYSLTCRDVEGYFRLAGEELMSGDLEGAARHLGVAMGALCSLIPHGEGVEEAALRCLGDAEAFPIDDPCRHLSGLGELRNPKDYASEYKSIALTMIERFSRPREAALSSPELSLLSAVGFALTAVAFAVAARYAARYSAEGGEVMYDGLP